MNPTIISILAAILGIGGGIGGTIAYYSNKENNLNKKIEDLNEKARKEAEKIKRDAILEAKEENHKLKVEVDREIKEKKDDLREQEEKINQREKNIDKREEMFQKREQNLEEKENKIYERQQKIQAKEAKVEEIKQQQLDLLQEISGYDKEKAKKLVMTRVEEAMNKEINEYINERENEAKLEADKKAKDLLVSTMQRFSNDVASGETVTVVNLPNDEMKGRIIGREGRNIRTIEAITGVDLIIDDTPEAVVLSSFDPYRREIARITLETLVKDGRIHPTKIEELYDKVCKDMKAKLTEYGNDALFELGLTKMEPDLIELVGKLHFRTSYGQNVLQHSIEVAHLAGIMAGEIGENVNLAKRAGLLHDIGKSIDHENEGSHVDLGVDLAKKYKENDVVVNTIASHHGDTEATSVIAALVAIADALSASRPGARNDSLENYIKRLEQLEAVGKDIEGIDKTYAVQAGRELRVVVKPEKIDDLGAHKIAREIKDKIESTMQYPGTIKITVVRETRAEEEAK